jgi:hypothetical protein
MTEENNQLDAHNSELISEELDQSQHQSPQRHRRRVLVYSALSIVLIVSFVVSVLHGMRLGGLLAWLPIPTPTAFPSATTAVEILTDVNWGTVRLNGKVVKIGNGSFAWPTNGNNTLTIDAQPFKHTACTFTWPDIQASTIRLTSENQCIYLGTHTGTQGSYSLIGIDVTLHDLPDIEQQHIQTLITSYAQKLTQSTEVHIGDHYATGYDANHMPIVQQATQSMQAQFIMSPDSPIQGFPFNGCSDMICPVPSYPNQEINSASTHDWQININFNVSWQFINDKGTTTSLIPAFVQAILFSFTLHNPPNDMWTIEANSNTNNTIDSSVCSSLIASSLSSVVASPVDHASVEGCQVTATPRVNGTPILKFLVRFGAILTVDDSTASRFPQLPRATPAEIAAVG